MMFEYVVTASASAIAAAPRMATSPAVSAAVWPVSAASELAGSPAAAAVNPAPAIRPVRRNDARLVLLTDSSSSSIGIPPLRTTRRSPPVRHGPPLFARTRGPVRSARLVLYVVVP